MAAAARADLDEAFEIAERIGMRLHLCDAHLVAELETLLKQRGWLESSTSETRAESTSSGSVASSSDVPALSSSEGVTDHLALWREKLAFYEAELASPEKKRGPLSGYA